MVAHEHTRAQTKKNIFTKSFLEVCFRVFRRQKS